MGLYQPREQSAGKAFATETRTEVSEGSKMIRFLIGVGLGAALMYWYLTGEVPLRVEIERFLSTTGSSYSSSTLAGGEGARR